MILQDGGGVVGFALVFRDGTTQDHAYFTNIDEKNPKARWSSILSSVEFT
jgi:hypothetical protein